MQSKSASNVKVIDVSHHQGAVDWAKVKADGVVGAFIKATEGGSVIDDTFVINVAGAAANGIKVGFYHYAHPELNSAVKEAATFASTVKGKCADFPHVLDVEGAASKAGAALTAWCVTWLNEVERLTGHPTMVYTGASFAKSYLGKDLGKWPLWVAHYGATTPMANATWNAWSVFQYTSSGKVAGIAGNVDVNVMERAFYVKYTEPVPAPVVPQPPADVVDITPKIIRMSDNAVVATGTMADGRVVAPIAAVLDAIGVAYHWDNETKKLYLL